MGKIFFYTTMLILIGILFYLYTVIFPNKGIVREINQSPFGFYAEVGFPNGSSILPPKKLYKRYRYIYITERYDIDLFKYLKNFPEDAVEKKCFGGIDCTTYIFSNREFSEHDRSEFLKK